MVPFRLPGAFCPPVRYRPLINSTAINGIINHYPDFIVRTSSGKIVIIETKGSTSSDPSDYACFFCSFPH